MTAKIESVCIGSVVTEGETNTDDPTRKRWTSAFGKRPVNHPAQVHVDRIDGDHVANTVNHGGVDKAILCYTASHHDDWAAEFPTLSFGPGAMGENLTIRGLDETGVCIGDRYAAGDVVLEVSQPRGPCWKIDRYHQHPGVLRRVVATGRTGWYVRVIQTGTLAAGETITRVHREHPNWPVCRALDVLLGREKDPSVRRALKTLPGLAPAFVDTL